MQDFTNRFKKEKPLVKTTSFKENYITRADVKIAKIELQKDGGYDLKGAVKKSL